MRDILEFLNATLPWIAMELLLAGFFVGEIRRKKDNDRHEDFIAYCGLDCRRYEVSSEEGTHEYEL